MICPPQLQPPELQGAHRRSAGSAVPAPRSACFALAKRPQKRPKRGGVFTHQSWENCWFNGIANGSLPQRIGSSHES